MELDRRAFLTSLGGAAAIEAMPHEERADALEHYMMDVELKRGGWDPRDTAEVERLGSIGFELVTVLPMANGHLLFFKRRVA